VITSTYRVLIDTIFEGRDFIRIIVKLARAELQEQASKVVRGSTFGLAAVFLLLLALIFLLLGVAEVIIAYGWPSYVAFFIVGGSLIVLSIFLSLGALLCFKNFHLSPDRALDKIHKLSATHQEHFNEPPAPQ
jgi:uncharacterized membrane protein YqjE